MTRRYHTVFVHATIEFYDIGVVLFKKFYEFVYCTICQIIIAVYKENISAARFA